MKVHDNYIKQIMKMFESRDIKECTVLDNPYSNWKVVRNSDFIMDKEVGVELGSTGNTSVSINLSSSTMEIEDKIYLIGKDIDRLTVKNPYFAKVVITKIKDEKDENLIYKNIKSIQRAKFCFNLEGTMLRASNTESRECFRISKKAKKKGLNFSVLGSMLLSEIKKNDSVLNAQVYYVVGDEKLISFLKEYPEKIFKTVDAMNHMFDNIELDCASCNIKEVCDEVEGMREAHEQKVKSFKQ